MARPGWPSKRTLFRIHGWLGLNLGLLLFIVCFSGTVATLSHEIDWLLNPALRAESRGSSAWSWEGWYQAVRAEHPDAHVAVLEAPPTGGWAARAMVAYGPSDLRYVYVHPDSGDVQGTFSHFNVARFFRSFHKQLYIYPGSLPHGVYAVGPLAIVLLLSAVTALAFYAIRWNDLLLRQRAAGARAFWSSVHRAAGVWTLPLTVVFAVTGLWYLVERAAADAGAPLGRVEVLASNASVAVEAGAARRDLDSCIDRARQAFPAFDVRSVFFPRRAAGAVTLYGQADAWLVRGTANYVVVDPYSGAVLERQDAADLPLGSRLIQSADPLHFGTFGGLTIKLLWFAAGLVISASVLAGIRIWHLRMRHGRDGLRPRAAGITRGGLAVTFGVLALTVYGSIVNIAESISHDVAGPGPELAGAADVPGLVPPYVWTVVGGFVLCTVLISVATLMTLRAPLPTARRQPRGVAPGAGVEQRVRREHGVQPAGPGAR